MLKVGLTGGIGCGKSAAVSRFKTHGVPVVDADLIARQVVEVGEPALQQIAQTFGSDMLTADGALDRTKLREQVFSHPQKLEQLESILHPIIRARLEKAVNEHNNAPYILIDVPLLIEKGYKSFCDRVIVVDCLPGQQLSRVTQRDASSESLVKKIIQQQVSREERLRHATDVLDNSTTLEHLHHAVDELHVKLLTLSHP